jgi:hypothetical protein
MLDTFAQAYHFPTAWRSAALPYDGSMRKPASLFGKRTATGYRCRRHLRASPLNYVLELSANFERPKELVMQHRRTDETH